MTTTKKTEGSNKVFYIAIAALLALIALAFLISNRPIEQPVAKETTIIEQPAVIETDR